MTNKEKIWKCEYENLRRKKNKEIDTLQRRISRFTTITYNVLESLGLSFRDIMTLYKVESERYETERKIHNS